MSWSSGSFTFSTVFFRSPTWQTSPPLGWFSCPASSAAPAVCILDQMCVALVQTLQKDNMSSYQPTWLQANNVYKTDKWIVFCFSESLYGRCRQLYIKYYTDLHAYYSHVSFSYHIFSARAQSGQWSQWRITSLQPQTSTLMTPGSSQRSSVWSWCGTLSIGNTQSWVISDSKSVEVTETNKILLNISLQHLWW